MFLIWWPINICLHLLKTLEQRSLDILQSINPSDYEKMPEVAKIILDITCYLLVNFEPLSEGMREYIQYTSSLARIGGFMHKDLSSE